MFDLTRRESFLKLVSWLAELKDLADEHLVIILVGNKSDLNHRRVISYEEASSFAASNGFLYMECSAKTGSNVAEVFTKACEGVLHNIENNVYGSQDINFVPGIRVGNIPNKDNKLVDITTNNVTDQSEENKEKSKCC